jgi:hypothetical protein
MQQSAMCTCLMSPLTSADMTTLNQNGNRLFAAVDGLHEAGLYKNSLLPNQSTSFREKVSGLATRILDDKRFTKQRTHHLRLFVVPQ